MKVMERIAQIIPRSQLSKIQAYTPVSAAEKEDSSSSPDTESLSPTSSFDAFPRTRITDISITIICTFLLLTTFQWLYHLKTFNPDTLYSNALSSVYSDSARLSPQYHCGNSSTSALELGCIFDLSLVGWVPAPCFDPLLNQRFMDWGWRFFSDQNGTHEVSLEYIANSAGTREPFWAQHGYHITHCELAWERMHRAIRGEGPRLTTHLLNLEHTRHCGMMSELRDDFYSLNSQILPLLNTC